MIFGLGMESAETRVSTTQGGSQTTISKGENTGTQYYGDIIGGTLSASASAASSSFEGGASLLGSGGGKGKQSNSANTTLYGDNQNQLQGSVFKSKDSQSITGEGNIAIGRNAIIQITGSSLGMGGASLSETSQTAGGDFSGSASTTAETVRSQEEASKRGTWMFLAIAGAVLLFTGVLKPKGAKKKESKGKKHA